MVGELKKFTRCKILCCDFIESFRSKNVSEDECEFCLLEVWYFVFVIVCCLFWSENELKVNFYHEICLSKEHCLENIKN